MTITVDTGRETIRFEQHGDLWDRSIDDIPLDSLTGPAMVAALTALIYANT